MRTNPLGSKEISLVRLIHRSALTVASGNKYYVLKHLLLQQITIGLVGRRVAQFGADIAPRYVRRGSI